jgi:Icc-related predicted phosphoesterase
VKIVYGSDIHLEFGQLSPPKIPMGDVLVLAGDICVAKNLTPEDILFFNTCSKTYKNVIYVMGNHEHYHGDFLLSKDRILNKLPVNVHLLDKSSVVVDGVKFCGGTLWTDIANGNDLVAKRLKQSMNDYVQIKNFGIEGSIKDFNETVEYLQKELDGSTQTVVVTHHAPSYKSVNPKYWNSNINNGFYSDLDSLILEKQPGLWIHGHMHDAVDYNIEKTRVVCNPRGYYRYEPQSFNFAWKIVEI